MKKTLLATSFLALGAFAFVAPSISYADDGSALVKTVDKDSDGTIDMAEAKNAAMASFAMADKDKDGTLDSKEAGMDVSKADPDKDGTVDAAELASPEGQKLQAMIK